MKRCKKTEFSCEVHQNLRIEMPPSMDELLSELEKILNGVALLKAQGLDNEKTCT